MENNFVLIKRYLKESFLTLPPPTPSQPQTFHFLRPTKNGRKTNFIN